MIKLLLHTCFVFALSLGFTSGSADLDSSPYVNIERFAPDDDRDTIDRRKRAHKRKRQIRPRRNGF